MQTINLLEVYDGSQSLYTAVFTQHVLVTPLPFTARNRAYSVSKSQFKTAYIAKLIKGPQAPLCAESASMRF